METLYNMLKRHEGLENYPYNCSAGTLTIGYGRNLEAVGISDDEAEMLLVHDMEDALRNFQELIPASSHISPARKIALTNMIFNLGRAGFLTFRKMIDAILNAENEADWNKVADEAKNSKWFRQVGVRGAEIVSILRNG